MTTLLELVKVKSATVRVLHWVIFLATVDLLLTGLYVGSPAALLSGTGEPYQTFVMAKIRLLHFAGAIALAAAFLLRLYLAFFSAFHRDWREVLPTAKNIAEAVDTIRYYWTFEGRLKEYRWVDPLDGLTFLALFLAVLAQVFTGFALYAPGIELNSGILGAWAATIHFMTGWTSWLFGGLPGVRLAHHLTQWIIVSGALLHVYLQVWKTIKLRRANISAMVGGYKLMAARKGE